MAASKKDSVVRTYTIRADLVRRMDEYKKISGVPHVFTLERALERYLDEVEPEAGRGSNAGGR